MVQEKFIWIYCRVILLVLFQFGRFSYGQDITTLDLGRDITRVVTGANSDIYVGGVNFVAQFTNKLEDLIRSISIGPVYEAKDCAPNRAPCNNTVRVLELIKELGLLLVCGTAYDGTCTLHSLVDITDWFCLVGNIDPDAAVFTSHVNQTTVVHLLPPTDDISSAPSESREDGYECRPRNFSQDFFNFANNDIRARIQKTKVSTFRNKLEKRSSPNPSEDSLFPTVRVMVAGNIQRSAMMSPVMLSMRSIRFSDNHFIIDYVNDPGTQKKGIDIDPNIRSNFAMDYKFSFTWEKFSFFLTVQENIMNGEKNSVTKLSRVPNNGSQIVPFVEVTLECAQNRTTYHLATTATFVQTNFPLGGNCVPIPVLLVAFGSGVTPKSTTADPSKGGSMCAFFIDDLVKNEFDYALNLCNGGDNMLSEPPYWIKEAPKICQSINLTGQNNPYVKSIFEVSVKSLLNVSTFISAIYSYVPKISNNPDSKFSNIIDVFFITGTGSMENMNLQVSTSDRPAVTVDLIINMEFPFGKEMMEHSLTAVGFVDDIRANLYLAVGTKIMRMSVNFCRQFLKCEDCLSLHEFYTCKWCSHLNICQDSKLTCNGREEGTCPPKLEKFSPEFFPTEGGSLLTLDIANYRMPQNDTLKVTVTICDQPCEANFTKQSPVTCIVPACRQCKTSPRECNVTVKLEQLKSADVTLSSFSLTHHPTFKYVSPKVESLAPNFGPIFGGTLLEFKGKYLRSGTKRSITVAGINCVIQDTPQIMDLLRCHTGKHQSGKPLRGVVTVHIDKFQYNVSRTQFTYKANPVITSIKPGNTIQSGGTDVIVTGTNLSSAVFSELVIFYNDTFANKSFVAKGQCFHKSNMTQMRCVTPNVYNITSPYFTRHPNAVQIEAQVTVEMDGHDMIASAASISKKLMIHRDPDFYSIISQDNILSAKYPNITLWGKNLPVWMDKNEIKVIVGEVPCPLKVVFADHLVCNAHNLIEKVRHEQNQRKFTDTNEDTTAMTTVFSTTAYTSAEHSNGSTTTLTTDTVNENHFDHVAKVQIGNYRKELGSVKASLLEPEDVQQSNLKMYVGAGVAGLVIVMLLVATMTVFMRFRKSKTSKFQPVNDSGSDVATKPNLKQILASVVEMGKNLEMDNLIISVDQLIIGRTIGTGNFGLVYEGLLMTGSGLPPQPVAVKTLRDPMAHNIDLLSLVQEAVIMREFQHPNVLGLIGLAEKEPGVPYVILPFMENHDLLTYVRDTSVTLTLHDVIKYAADITNGMAYLSKLRCVHRDLSARNCMLDLNHQVKVADFGLCRDVYERGYYKCDQKQKLPIRWMAIESIAVGSYSSKSDVWSYGVVLWEMLTRGMIPYPCVDGWEVIKFLKHHRLAQPHFCPDVMYRHMMSCWDEDPDQRPSFEALQTELLELIDGGQQVSSVASTTTYPNNHFSLSVDGQTAGFSNYQNASTIPLELSKQNTKGHDQVRGHVKDEMRDFPILNFSERKEILNVVITMPACYSLKDRSEPMSVAQSHHGLHRNLSEIGGEETEYV